MKITFLHFRFRLVLMWHSLSSTARTILMNISGSEDGAKFYLSPTWFRDRRKTCVRTHREFQRKYKCFCMFVSDWCSCGTLCPRRHGRFWWTCWCWVRRDISSLTDLVQGQMQNHNSHAMHKMFKKYLKNTNIRSIQREFLPESECKGTPARESSEDICANSTKLQASTLNCEHPHWIASIQF